MSTGTFCPSCHASEHQLMACVLRDYVQWWRCQHCGHTWVRWPENHPFYPWAKAQMDRALSGSSITKEIQK